MSLILNIETATKNCSVALAKSGEILTFREIAGTGYSHAEKLHVFIDEVIKDSGLKFTDLSAVAVSKGPGSYTGLRIGVSAAKGLCYALGIPLISVDTLQVLANQISVSDGLIIPMIDARRMEVYSAVFNTAHEINSGVKAEIISPESYSEVNDHIHIIGDCQEKLRENLSSSNFIFHDEIVYPSSQQMAPLSFLKFKNSMFENLAYFEPLYLKEFLVAKPKS